MNALDKMEGFVADLYLKPPMELEKPPSVIKRERDYTKATVAMVAVASVLLGFGAYSITSFQPAPSPQDGILTLNITKFSGLDLTVGRRVVQLPNFDVDIGQSTCQMYNLTGTPKYYLRATVFAFEYTNLTPPDSFVEARLVLPVEHISSSAVNSSSVWGKDTGFDTERTFSVSIYEIRSTWPLGSSYPYYNGISWNDLMINTPQVNRNAVGTIQNVNHSNYWKEDFHYGRANVLYYKYEPLIFDISTAIEDWKAGLWNPSYGFLVAMIAPWETTDQPWFNSTGFKYLGFGFDYTLNGTQIQVGLFGAIPEFEMLIPIVGIMAIIILIRRKA